MTDTGTISTVRRVVCAAVRSVDGDVLIGIRHYSRDMHEQIESRHDGHKFKNRLADDQGFVDQWGGYMTRGEAYLVARDAKQLRYPLSAGSGLDGPQLYSEVLY